MKDIHVYYASRNTMCTKFIIVMGITFGYNHATLFVEHSTNTTNNLFVDPQKNLFVAICGLL